MKTIRYLIALGCLATCLFGQRIDFGTPTAPGTIPPRIISKTEPQYSAQASAAGIQGKVVLQLEVGTDGFAHNLQILKTLGSLDQRAMEAVRLWRFQPGTKDGRPVTVSGTVEVDFRLEFTQPESPFHLYARHDFERAIDSINFNLELRRKPLEKDRLQVPVSVSESGNGSAQEIEKLSNEIKTATEQVAAFEFRQKYLENGVGPMEQRPNSCK
jgi:TonB family protein